MQKNIFKPHNLLPCDGEAYLLENFLTHSVATHLQQQLRTNTQWEQRDIIIFGKRVNQPRLMAWHGDKEYTYSGITLVPLEWTTILTSLKQKIESATQTSFNSALLNLYRDGQDSMGWHQDNERSLGQQPIIASLSLGAERKFKFKHHRDGTKCVDVILKHGSLLVMSGMTQHRWKHCLPKSKIVPDERINITFRKIFHE